MKTTFCHCILLPNLSLFGHPDLFEISYMMLTLIESLHVSRNGGGGEGVPQGAFKSWFLTGFGAGGRLWLVLLNFADSSLLQLNCTTEEALIQTNFHSVAKNDINLFFIRCSPKLSGYYNLIAVGMYVWYIYVKLHV